MKPIIKEGILILILSVAFVSAVPCDRASINQTIMAAVADFTINPSNSTLSLQEITDLRQFYSRINGSMPPNCNVTGESSGLLISEILSKADALQEQPFTLPDCEIAAAYFSNGSNPRNNDITVFENDTVYLIAETRNCDGKTAEFVIEEKDIFFNDYITTLTAIVQNGKAVVQWRAAYVNDPVLGVINTNPEYIFTVKINPTMVSANMANVRKAESGSGLPSSSSTPRQSPTPSASASPTPYTTSTPSISPSPYQSPTPWQTPEISPIPYPTASLSPNPAPTSTATEVPTTTPTASPSSGPSPTPPICEKAFGKDGYIKCPIVKNSEPTCEQECCVKGKEQCCHLSESISPICCKNEPIEKCFRPKGLLVKIIGKDFNSCMPLKCTEPGFPKLCSVGDYSTCCRADETCSSDYAGVRIIFTRTGIPGLSENLPMCTKSECDSESGEHECTDAQPASGKLCCKSNEECVQEAGFYWCNPTSCPQGQELCIGQNQAKDKVNKCCQKGTKCMLSANGAPRCI